jgi:hypothetical protein
VSKILRIHEKSCTSVEKPHHVDAGPEKAKYAAQSPTSTSFLFLLVLSKIQI